jgi:hypothetical protein
MAQAPNTLYSGDNLDILRRYIEDESVDLVYLDPPFNGSRDYNVLFAEQDDAVLIPEKTNIEVKVVRVEIDGINVGHLPSAELANIADAIRDASSPAMQGSPRPRGVPKCVSILNRASGESSVSGLCLHSPLRIGVPGAVAQCDGSRGIPRNIADFVTASGVREIWWYGDRMNVTLFPGNVVQWVE